MYHFIVNPNANQGHGQKVWEDLERCLQRGRTEYEVLMTRVPGDAWIFASRLTKHCQEPRIIIAVGGSGTVNEILNGLSFDGNVTFGYIPTDYKNDLAKSLRLSRSPRRCLDRILNCPRHCWLDYGVLSYENGEPLHRRFMVSSGIGLDAAAFLGTQEIQSSKRRLPRLPKRLSYMLMGIWKLFRFVPVRGYLVLDGTKKIEFNHIYFVSVHIHPYEGGGFRFAPKANGSDGMLEVCVVHNSSRMGVLAAVADAF